MKKILSFVILIILLVFTIIFNIYNSNKKYLILSNDYMFQINNNDIKIIKKFPSYLNNSKITYYDNGIKEDGYIKIKTKKLFVDQVNGNNIDFYSHDYKLISDNHLLATSGMEEIDVLDFKSNEIKVITDEDRKIIQEYLDEESEDSFEVQYLRKYTIDIDSDNKNDYIYVISNINLDDLDKYSLTNSSSDKKMDNYVVYGFIKNDNSYISLFKNSGKKLYKLGNVFDYNNDKKYELNFSINDYEDYNYHCETIYKLTNNNFEEFRNCNTEDK